MIKLSKDKQKKISLIAVGALALCGALWYFLVSLPTESFVKYEENIRDIQDKINKAEMRIKRTAMLQAELTELRQQIAEAEGKMIPIEQLNGKKWLLDKLLRQHNLWVLFLHKPHSEPVISGLSNLFATANVWSPVPPEAAKLPSSRRASGGDELRASSSRRRRSLRVTDSPACCWEASFSPTDSAIEPIY